MSLTADPTRVALAPADDLPQDREVVIQPRRGWIGVDVEELLRFRELLMVLVWRDVKVRYKQTVLGVAWALLVPLTQLIVFTWVFGGLKGFSSNLPPALKDAYPVFLFCGQLPWLFFAASLSQGGLSLLNNQNLLTKVYFPRLFVPTAVVFGALVDMAFTLTIAAATLWLYHVAPSWQIIFFPFLMVVLVVMGLGMAYTLSALTVTYRDFRFIVPFLAQLWMFASPVLYPINPNPDHHPWLAAHTWVLGLNPMYGIINAVRSSILGGDKVPWQFGALAMSMLLTAGIFVFGLFYFRKTERRFADIA